MPFGRRRARRRRGLTAAVLTYSDPVQHALIAAAVSAPLVPRAGRIVLRTAVAVSSASTSTTPSPPARRRCGARSRSTTRPQTHSLLAAAAGRGDRGVVRRPRARLGGVRRARLASAARRRATRRRHADAVAVRPRAPARPALAAGRAALLNGSAGSLTPPPRLHRPSQRPVCYGRDDAQNSSAANNVIPIVTTSSTAR